MKHFRGNLPESPPAIEGEMVCKYTRKEIEVVITKIRQCCSLETKDVVVIVSLTQSFVNSRMVDYLPFLDCGSMKLNVITLSPGKVTLRTT